MRAKGVGCGRAGMTEMGVSSGSEMGGRGKNSTRDHLTTLLNCHLLQCLMFPSEKSVT